MIKNYYFRSLSISTSSQKVNLIASLIRKKTLSEALNLLIFLPNKGAREIYKFLKGLVKELEKNEQSSHDFFFSRIEANQGRTIKKAIYRAKGRTDKIRKRSCVLKFNLSQTINVNQQKKSVISSKNKNRCKI